MTTTTVPTPTGPLPTADEKPILDIEEAGRYLGMSRVVAYRAAKSGYLPTVQVSERRFKVPTAALRTMLGMDAG